MELREQENFLKDHVLLYFQNKESEAPDDLDEAFPG